MFCSARHTLVAISTIYIMDWCSCSLSVSWKCNSLCAVTNTLNLISERAKFCRESATNSSVGVENSTSWLLTLYTCSVTHVLKALAVHLTYIIRYTDHRWFHNDI